MLEGSLGSAAAGKHGRTRLLPCVQGEAALNMRGELDCVLGWPPCGLQQSNSIHSGAPLPALQVKLMGVMVIEAKSNIMGIQGIQIDLFANKGIGELPAPQEQQQQAEQQQAEQQQAEQQQPQQQAEQQQQPEKRRRGSR